MMRTFKGYVVSVLCALSMIMCGGLAWAGDTTLTKQIKMDTAFNSNSVYHAVALQPVDKPDLMAVAVKVLAAHDKESKHSKALSGFIFVNSAIKKRYCCRNM